MTGISKLQTLFEKSQEGHKAFSLPRDEEAWIAFKPPQELLRASPLFLPELSELDLTRHFIGLSSKNVGIDNMLIPLGSCTMKFNPRLNEVCASLPGFSSTHPYAPDDTVQGNLKLITSLLSFFMELTGMKGGTLVPNAGAQGELTGVKMIAAYHKKRGDHKRTEFLVPDSAHGTNPATVSMAGFEVKSIGTDAKGEIDLNALKNALCDKTAGILLTNPSTLGLFSSNILEITQLVHDAGGLVYYDGANLNPILTVVKPAEMGFDVMHMNLHKTFSTPHGGGGPGSGPVLCNEKLKPFLPLPRVEGKHTVWEDNESIGFIASFFGNFGIYLRAYAYILFHGYFGLRRIAENAVLNANYLKTKLLPYFDQPFPQNCMHEFVVSCTKFKAQDFAKRLLDYGVHAPTVYFPLIVKECFLIEPPESESKRTLDRFALIIKEISQEDPEILKTAPHTLSVSRLNETLAAKHPILIDPVLTKLRTWKLNTSNMGKFEEFKRLFAKYGTTLEATHIDLEEIHASPIEVVAHKASQLGDQILVEDTCLDIVGESVGVNIRWLLDHLKDLAGKKAEWSVLLAYRQGNEVLIYKGSVAGTIVQPKGEGGFGFDPVFKPDGEELTLAESKPDHVNARAKAVEALIMESIYTRHPVIENWHGSWQ